MGADDDALFDMLRNEAVPPPLATAIVLKLLGHPDADPALSITPISAEPDHARGHRRPDMRVSLHSGLPGRETSLL